MKNTFINKVDAERRILSVVNRHTTGASQLAGLSIIAIDDWQRRTHERRIEDVVELLRALSDLCQRLSDRSHETFQLLAPGLQREIDDAMESLELKIVRAFK